jgi:hypothetical protein
MLLTNRPFQKRGLLLRNHFVPTSPIIFPIIFIINASIYVARRAGAWVDKGVTDYYTFSRGSALLRGMLRRTFNGRESMLERQR